MSHHKSIHWDVPARVFLHPVMTIRSLITVFNFEAAYQTLMTFFGHPKPISLIRTRKSGTHPTLVMSFSPNCVCISSHIDVGWFWWPNSSTYIYIYYNFIYICIHRIIVLLEKYWQDNSTSTNRSSACSIGNIQHHQSTWRWAFNDAISLVQRGIPSLKPTVRP